MAGEYQGTSVRREKRPAARIELDNGVSVLLHEASFPLTIGRHANCDICIPRANVSRQHCELDIQDGELYLKDTSTNGTTVDFRSIKQVSVPVQARTSFFMANEVMLTVTPLVGDRSNREGGVPPGRRQGERRQGERRQNVSAVNFERRRGGDRRMRERRADFRS